jgi:hypothetical protein
LPSRAKQKTSRRMSGLPGGVFDHCEVVFMIDANYSDNTLKRNKFLYYESFYNTDLRATCPHRGSLQGTYFLEKGQKS